MTKPKLPSPPPPPDGDEDPIWGDLFSHLRRAAPHPSPAGETPASPPKPKAPTKSRKPTAKPKE